MKIIKKIISFLYTIVGPRFVARLIRFIYRLYMDFIDRIIMNPDVFGLFIALGLVCLIIGGAGFALDWVFGYTVLFFISGFIGVSFLVGLGKKLFVFIITDDDVKKYFLSRWK